MATFMDFVRLDSPRGSIPGCTFDHPAKFCIAFQSDVSQLAPSACITDTDLSFAASSRICWPERRIMRDRTKRFGTGVLAQLGSDYAAARMKRRQVRLGAPTFLDEVIVAFAGRRRVSLWRAVDQDGDLIDLLVQPRRDEDGRRRRSSSGNS